MMSCYKHDYWSYEYHLNRTYIYIILLNTKMYVNIEWLQWILKYSDAHNASRSVVVTISVKVDVGLRCVAVVFWIIDLDSFPL